MKKKIIAVLLAVSTVTMIGCSNSTSSTSENKPQEEKTEITNNEVKAEEVLDNEVKSEVLLDNEVVKITLLGVNESALMGPEMKVEIENKTDKTITIQLNETSVDGVMAEPVFSCEVAAGKKAKDEITFMSSDVTKLNNVEGLFHIFTSDNWDTIGDYSFTALTSEKSGQTSEAAGIVLVDNESVKITYVGQGKDSVFGPELNFQIENKGGSTITVQGREISVDGFMAEPIFSSDIATGKKANASMTFMEEDLTELKNIEGLFHVFNSDSWDDIGDYSFKIEK